MNALKKVSGRLTAGTMMVQEGLLVPDTVKMETDAYSEGWRSVRALDSFAMARALSTAGLHLFFIAGHLTSIAFGRGGDKSLRRAIAHITSQVRELDFNCVELSDIHKKHFLGVPYVLVSAHAYHIQTGWQLQETEVRGRALRCAEWASDSGVPQKAA
jgi:hypothetical protein